MDLADEVARLPEIPNFNFRNGTSLTGQEESKFLLMTPSGNPIEPFPSQQKLDPVYVTRAGRMRISARPSLSGELVSGNDQPRLGK